jgi:hypothetical protein
MFSEKIKRWASVDPLKQMSIKAEGKGARARLRALVMDSVVPFAKLLS